MVRFGKETVIVEKQGKPIVAIIDVDLYERWQAERESRFRVFDEVRSKNRGRRSGEVEKDVAEAVSETRKGAHLLRGRRAQGSR